MSTQKELAKYAGVSAGTVSNVISGSTPVSEASRKKVLDAIRALNYQPNLIARSLKTNRTYTLGILVPDITIAFYTKVIRGAESAARDRDHFLVVLDSQGSHELEVKMLALLRQRVDGILFVTAGDYKWSAEDARQITSGPPVVCVDRRPEGLHVDSVCVDDSGAAEVGVAHLVERGHREIAIVTGPLTLRNEQERLHGYERALRKANLKTRRNLIWSAGFEQKGIDAVCQQGMLRSAARPSALFATNGVTGLGALRSLYAMGFSTPADLAFATIDDVMTDHLFKPAITSVIQPAHEIGYRAIEVLFDRFANPKINSARAIMRLPATLVVQESSQTYSSAPPTRAAKRRK
jgi:DNA-binding LacI/PurR family transcriptional regulator